MTAIYYISVSILALAAILIVGAGVTAIIHILRHPDDRSVQDLEGPLREYALDDAQLQEATESVARSTAAFDKSAN